MHKEEQQKNKNNWITSGTSPVHEDLSARCYRKLRVLMFYVIYMAVSHLFHCMQYNKGAPGETNHEISSVWCFVFLEIRISQSPQNCETVAFSEALVANNRLRRPKLCITICFRVSPGGNWTPEQMRNSHIYIYVLFVLYVMFISICFVVFVLFKVFLFMYCIWFY